MFHCPGATCLFFFSDKLEECRSPWLFSFPSSLPWPPGHRQVGVSLGLLWTLKRIYSTMLKEQDIAAADPNIPLLHFLHISSDKQANALNPVMGGGHAAPSMGMAAAAFLKATTHHSCCLILLTDGETAAITDSMVTYLFFLINVMVALAIRFIHLAFLQKKIVVGYCYVFTH